MQRHSKLHSLDGAVILQQEVTSHRVRMAIWISKVNVSVHLPYTGVQGVTAGLQTHTVLCTIAQSNILITVKKSAKIFKSRRFRSFAFYTNYLTGRQTVTTWSETLWGIPVCDQYVMMKCFEMFRVFVSHFESACWLPPAPLWLETPASASFFYFISASSPSVWKSHFLRR